MRQRDGDSVLFVPPPNRLGKFHLLNQLRHQRLGQGDHPVLSALGTEEKETGLFKVDILDSQVEGFGDTQAAAINQAGDEIGGITRPILNSLEQGLSFGDGGCMAQAGGPSGAEGIHTLKRLTQDLLVKVENGVERLILAVGRQITVARQIGEEKFEFLLAGKRGGHGIERDHIMTEPVDVGGFSCKRHVLAAQDVAETFDGDGQIHNDVSLTGWVGQRLSKQQDWINEPAVADPNEFC